MKMPRVFYSYRKEAFKLLRLTKAGAGVGSEDILLLLICSAFSLKDAFASLFNTSLCT